MATKTQQRRQGISSDGSGLDEIFVTSGTQGASNADARPLRPMSIEGGADTTSYKDQLLGSAKVMGFTTQFRILLPVCVVVFTLVFNFVFRGDRYGKYKACLADDGVSLVLNSSYTGNSMTDPARYQMVNETLGEIFLPSELNFYCLLANTTGYANPYVNAYSGFQPWLDLMPLYGLMLLSSIAVIWLLVRRLMTVQLFKQAGGTTKVSAEYKSLPIDDKDDFGPKPSTNREPLLPPGDEEAGTSPRPRASTFASFRTPATECPCGIPLNDSCDSRHADEQRESILHRYYLHMVMELGQNVCPCPDCHQVFEASASDNSFNSDLPVSPMIGEENEDAPCWFSPRALFALLYSPPLHRSEFYLKSRHGMQMVGIIISGFLVALLFAITPTAMQHCRVHLPLDVAANLTCPVSPIQTFTNFAENCDGCSIALISLNNAAVGWYIGMMLFVAIANGWQPSRTTAKAYRDHARELFESHPNAARILSVAIGSSNADEKLKHHASFLKLRYGAITSMVLTVVFFFFLYAMSLLLLLFNQVYGEDAVESIGLFAENGYLWAAGLLCGFSTTISMLIILRLVYIEAPTTLKKPLMEQIHLTSLLDPSILFPLAEDRPVANSEREVEVRFDEDRAYIADWLRARRFHYRFVINFELKSIQAFLVALLGVSIMCFAVVLANAASLDWDIQGLLIPLSVLMIFICLYAAVVLVTYFSLITKLLESDTAQTLVVHSYSYFCYTREFIYRVHPSISKLVTEDYKSFQAFISHISSMLNTDHLEPHAVIFGITVHSRLSTLARSYLASVVFWLMGVVLSQLF